MNIQLTKDKAEILLQLVYLGNHIVNGHRKSPLSEYENLAEELYSAFASTEEGNTASLHDKLYDSTAEYLRAHRLDFLQDLICNYVE